jgi:hypothetical protein
MERLAIRLIGCWVLCLMPIYAYSAEMTAMEQQEMLVMMAQINHGTIAYRATVMQKMLQEANYFSDRLNLPISRPIQITDIQYPFIALPWFSVVRDESTTPWAIISPFGTNIFDSRISREQRLKALEIGAMGTIETTNFEFMFYNGKLWQVMRLSEHHVEYYAHDFDKLLGKPSLIDTNGAYQLATQWLAAVDVDMTRLDKLKWTLNQLHYLARGATNYVTLPLYYVDFGSKHYAASNNLKAFDEPLVSVEILGATKELQDLIIYDRTLSRRPLLLITNVLDLVQTANPKMKQLEHPAAP